MSREISAVLRTAVTIAIAACGHASDPAPAGPPLDVPIAITGATLWDGTGRPPVPEATTVVVRDRIACAGSAAECPVPRGARVVNARGQWLIPGLIDTHVHLLFLQNGSATPELGLDLRDLLARGITTVRDMGTSPADLLARTSPLAEAPRVYAMQLVGGRRFFFSGFHGQQTPRGVIYREAPARTMQRLGWTPILFNPGDDPDEVIASAREAGAIGLKLYAQLDSVSIRKLSDAAHRAGMTVWGHAWVQPASVLEQVQAGQDGVVHAAGLAGELFAAAERDTLVADGLLQTATATAATVASAHDPRVLATLDSMARHGTYFEPTLDATRHAVARYDAEILHRPSDQERYVRAAAQFGVALTREAAKRGVRIVAGSDHVAYGPAGDRASLLGELTLLVDSAGFSNEAALLAATRDAARAIGGDPSYNIGTLEPGRWADLLILSANPLDDIRNLESVELVMRGGRLWRPGQLRSGIASAAPRDTADPSRSSTTAVGLPY